MNSLLYFPGSTFFFFMSMILLALVTSSLLPERSEGSPLTTQWVPNTLLLTVTVTLLWLVLIYPTQSTLFLFGHLLWDPSTAFLSIALLGFSLPIFIYANEILSQHSIKTDYYILCMLSLFGGLVMLTAGTTLTFYLGLEIMSLPLYGLVSAGLPRPLKIEAAMKYIVMGILSSVLLLYGFCLLYFLYHHLNLTTSEPFASGLSKPLLLISQSLVFAALLFKLGALPFHFWVPDVYQASSLSTNLFIATTAKFAAIGMGARLFTACLLEFSQEQQVLLGLGVLSILSGNLVALRQTQVRRLLAYSSIAHMGFLILSFAFMPHSYAIMLFYGMTYCLTASLLLGTLIYLKQSGLTIDHIESLKGLNSRYPFAAFLLLLSLSSMMGLPPLVGFFSKFGILDLLLQYKYYQMASITVLTTVIGAYYYLFLIRLMYFELPDNSNTSLDHTAFKITPTSTTLLVHATLLVGLSIWPDLLLGFLSQLV